MHTVGYAHRTATELLDLLRTAGVQLVVDVRLTPSSRKPGMSKRRLAEALAAAGIEYRHRPQLGNPRANRDALRRGDPQAHRVFADVLAGDDALAAVAEVHHLAGTVSVALLCVEHDPDGCHRTAVAAAVGLPVVHL